MKLQNVEEALAQIRPNLFRFLVEEGVYGNDSPNPKDYFICPNPNHDDKTPSTHILANGIKAYCHGCSKTFDILTLNHWLHNVPISGIGFITQNLMPLCTRYGVPFELGDLTEDDKFRIDAYHANRLAVDYILNQPWSDRVTNYVTQRGLTVELCRSLGIGVVPDYKDFETFMKERFTTVFLRDASFIRPGMFGPNNIIFTIKDATGAPVGFISRDLEFEEKYQAWLDRGRTGAPPRKYDSTSESNRIYFKRDLLFGFSDYLENRAEGAPLYVFEGQFDWAIAQANGLINCVALSGKVFTTQHLALLRKHKVEDIILVLDGDKSGREATRHLLLGEKDKPGMLTSASFCSIFVVELPEGEDPNSYIFKNGIDAFRNIVPIDSFTWALRNQDLDQDPVRTCEIMIPFILIESNMIRREAMVRILSECTGHSVKAIEDEILRKEDVAAAQTEKEKRAILEEAIREAQYGDTVSTQVLKTALERMEEIDKTTILDPLSVNETLAALDDQVEKEATLDGPSGFRFDKLTNLQASLDGDCTGTVIALGGVANTGKTALQSQLAKELVERNDDTIVIVHTIDDNRIQMNRRLAVQFAIDEAIRIGSPLAERLTLNKLANPKFWLEQYPHENEGLMELRDFGYAKLRQLIKDERLHIKDMTHGATVVFLEKMVKRARGDNPNGKIIAILDNFHKTQDFTNQDERTATKRKSQYLKTNIAQGYGATIFSTFEYKKIETGKRPTNNDLREAVNIEYDINYLEHLYSPLKAARDTGEEEKCMLWHGHPFNKQPIIEGDVGKNKINDLAPRHFYMFFPAQSRYVAISPEEALAITEGNRMETARDEGRSVIWKEGKRIEVIPREEASLQDVIPF